MRTDILNKNKLEIAFELAENVHKNQKDKAGNDYIEHLTFIAKNVDTINEKIVALIHDIPKYSKKYTINELTDKLVGYNFDEEVILALDSLTKKKYENYDEWLQRIAKNKIASKVKIADMKHNTMIERYSELKEDDKKRCLKYKKRILLLENYIKIDIRR